MAYPNSAKETVADGLVHALALVAVYLGAQHLGAAGAPASVMFYLYMAGGAFAVSALYHMTPWARVRPLLHRLDHAAIYFKIAGTYTPLVVMLGTSFSYLILTVVWTIALMGALAKLTFWKPGGRGSLTLYLVLGWASVLLACPIALRLGTQVLGFIVVGGLLYSLGSAVFARPSFRYQNPIWHGFVLSASACCFIAVSLAWSHHIEIGPYAGLDMPEPVTTQVLAPVPACHDHQMILQPFTFEHPQDNHPCPGFPIVPFDAAAL